jgi:hypothetical protein
MLGQPIHPWSNLGISRLSLHLLNATHGHSIILFFPNTSAIQIQNRKDMMRRALEYTWVVFGLALAVNSGLKLAESLHVPVHSAALAAGMLFTLAGVFSLLRVRFARLMLWASALIAGIYSFSAMLMIGTEFPLPMATLAVPVFVLALATVASLRTGRI